MKIAIGLFAHQEEQVIGTMISQVLAQDIFTNFSIEIQFLVLANGCTDATVKRASEAVQESSLISTNAVLEVCDIVRAGKSNAWNKFVHDLSDKEADYLIFLDADIEFGSTNVLSRVFEGLKDTPHAVAAVDQPKKDVERDLKKGFLGRLSVGLSSAKQNRNSVITGSLYCMRASVARGVFMPAGLPVEDGFLRAMLVTSNFTHQDEQSKIIAFHDVCHYFEAILDPITLYRHEKRLLIGSTVNMIIYTYLWDIVAKTGNDAGFIIKELNDEQPNWLAALVEDYKVGKGFWIVRRKMVFKRIGQLINGEQPVTKKILLFPLVLLASFVTLIIAIDVNIFFRKNNGVGHW